MFFGIPFFFFFSEDSYAKPDPSLRFLIFLASVLCNSTFFVPLVISHKCKFEIASGHIIRKILLELKHFFYLSSFNTSTPIFLVCINLWVAQFVREPARRAGDPGSNSSPGQNFLFLINNIGPTGWFF